MNMNFLFRLAGSKPILLWIKQTDSVYYFTLNERLQVEEADGAIWLSMFQRTVRGGGFFFSYWAFDTEGEDEIGREHEEYSICVPESSVRGIVMIW